MTIYEMNKEQIIETAEKIAEKTGCELLGLWTDLEHPYCNTIILVSGANIKMFQKIAYKVFNGLEDLCGNKLIEPNKLYESGYESCELSITDNESYFNSIIEVCEGVNWIE